MLVSKMSKKAAMFHTGHHGRNSESMKLPEGFDSSLPNYKIVPKAGWDLSKQGREKK